jgi:hemolysin III
MSARGKENMTNKVRDYSPGERIADGIIHALGISLSIAGFVVLGVTAMPSTDTGTAIALAVYGTLLVLMFCVSAAYHMVPHAHWKPALRKCDQAAIFLKIAGTYTPLVVILGSLFGYFVLVAVWVAALFGAIAKLALGRRFETVSVAIYLPLGWASLLLAWPIFSTLPVAVSVLVVAGGILYTVGVVFHTWEQLKFQNAIWHAFVLSASACHFAAVTNAAYAMMA